MVDTMAAIVTIVTTTVTFVVAFVSASNATASSVVALSSAKSASSGKPRAGAVTPGLQDHSFNSAIFTKTYSRSQG
jgi:hypothetical protein